MDVVAATASKSCDVFNFGQFRENKVYDNLCLLLHRRQALYDFIFSIALHFFLQERQPFAQTALLVLSLLLTILRLFPRLQELYFVSRWR